MAHTSHSFAAVVIGLTLVVAPALAQRETTDQTTREGQTGANEQPDAKRATQPPPPQVKRPADLDAFMAGAMFLLRAAKEQKDREKAKQQEATPADTPQQPVTEVEPVQSAVSEKPEPTPTVKRAPPSAAVKPLPKPVVEAPQQPAPSTARPVPKPIAAVIATPIVPAPLAPPSTPLWPFVALLLAAIVAAAYAVHRFFLAPPLLPAVKAFADPGSVSAPQFAEPDAPSISLMIGSSRFALASDLPETA